MSEHNEELVDRVAKALAEVEPGYAVGTFVKRATVALDALADELRHDPPEGCEWVALPTETVDWFVTTWTLIDGTPGWVVGDACRATVARRPKPERRTERVPWGSHLRGRFVPREPTPITSVWCGPDGIERYGGDGWERSVCSGPVGVPCDGKVEVLAKDEGNER